jgi:hypothetical protein
MVFQEHDSLLVMMLHLKIHFRLRQALVFFPASVILAQLGDASSTNAHYENKKRVKRADDL